MTDDRRDTDDGDKRRPLLATRQEPRSLMMGGWAQSTHDEARDCTSAVLPRACGARPASTVCASHADDALFGVRGLDHDRNRRRFGRGTPGGRSARAVRELQARDPEHYNRLLTARTEEASDVARSARPRRDPLRARAASARGDAGGFAVGDSGHAHGVIGANGGGCLPPRWRRRASSSSATVLRTRPSTLGSTRVPASTSTR